MSELLGTGLFGFKFKATVQEPLCRTQTRWTQTLVFQVNKMQSQILWAIVTNI